MSRKILANIVLVLMTAITATGQNMQSLYFLDNSLYGYRINPAIPSEKNFAGQIISNVDLSANSSLGLSNFVFKDSSGKMISGFNRALPTETFLEGISPSNNLGVVENLTILSCGFWTEKNFFHNIEFNVRGYQDASLPKDFFALLKEGNREEPYNLAGFRISNQSYLEFAYGMSKSLGDKISVGGRVKLLIGFLNLNAETNNTNLVLKANGSDPVKISDKQSAQAASSKINVFKPSGFGAVADLGITYKPLEDLSLNLAVLDLGAVLWKNGGEGRSFSTEMLPITFNAGARYRMPFYRRLSAGMLGSYRTGKGTAYSEFRTGITVTPIDWFSINGNYGFSSYGKTFGTALTLNLAFFHFHIGFEGYSGRVVKFISNGKSHILPLDKCRYDINLGLTIAFGERHR